MPRGRNAAPPLPAPVKKSEPKQRYWVDDRVVLKQGKSPEFWSYDGSVGDGRFEVHLQVRWYDGLGVDRVGWRWIFSLLAGPVAGLDDAGLYTYSGHEIDLEDAVKAGAEHLSIVSKAIGVACAALDKKLNEITRIVGGGTELLAARLKAPERRMPPAGSATRRREATHA